VRSGRRSISGFSVRASVPTLLLIVVFAIVLGVCGGVLYSHDRAPKDLGLAMDSESSAVPVSMETLDDRVLATARLQVAPAQPLTLARQGRLTDSQCVPGQTLASGEVIARIDDAQILALYTETPLWRDLSLGSRGPDVAAFQRELKRLGFSPDTDGVFGVGTRTAVRKLEHDVLKVSQPAGVVHSDTVLWIPQTEVNIASCSTRVGEQASGVFATIQDVPHFAEIIFAKDRVLVGQRAVALQADPSITAEVDADNRVTDPNFIGALLKNRVSTGQSDELSNEVSVEFYLTQPISAVGVPPSSLFDVNGNLACVVADGAPRGVTVLTSNFGQTYVEFSDGQPVLEVSVQPQTTGLHCP